MPQAPFNIPILSSFLETRVQICPDNPFIELRATNVLQTIQSVLMGVVFDKAEATRGLVVPVESHYKALNLTAPAVFASVPVIRP